MYGFTFWCRVLIVRQDVLRARVGEEEQTRTIYVPPLAAYKYTEVSFSF